MILSDALMVMLSRTEFISDKVLDLPSAWRQKDVGTFVVFLCVPHAGDGLWLDAMRR